MARSDDNICRQAALDILDHSAGRLSAGTYIKQIGQTLSLSPRQSKQILQQLIDDQDLTYNAIFGNTYVERSFLKPVQVTPHFTLSPPGFSPSSDTDTVHILLNQGISFGSGQHPTTRLCLEAIDDCLFEKGLPDLSLNSVGADIGTGSGVLAIALCRAGIKECRTWEIDPVSIHEAKKNIALNRLDQQIRVSDSYFTESRNAYAVICANLRWPTLKAIKDILYSSLQSKAPLILSGVREWEKKDLIDTYSKLGMKLIRQKDEKGWSGFVWIKND